MIRLAIITAVFLTLFSPLGAQARQADCNIAGLLQEREAALKDVSDGRGIHQGWIAYINAGYATPEQVRIGGSVAWHQHWVDVYDRITAVIEHSRPECNGSF